LTKLDDLREFIRNKNKKPAKSGENQEKQINKKFLISERENQEFSLEVAGSDATANPLASFGTEETDPDIVEQMYSSARNRVPKGEGASYWDQD
jgi:hypothetical protein